MRILIVEDNQRINGLISEGLSGRGFATDQAVTLEQAEEALAISSYDAIILDLGLPDGDGLAWLRSKGRGPALPPVLVLTARGALGDRVAGLDGGADDYVVKPVEIDELAARIRALLRRPGVRQQTVIRVGSITFDIAMRTARVAGEPVDLTRREADLLEFLMRSAGRIVTRPAMENAIYDIDAEVTPNAVEVIISRLRRKLINLAGTDILVNVRGVGYMLKPAVGDAPSRQGSECFDQN